MRSILECIAIKSKAILKSIKQANMNQENIKGQCEHCGYCFEGVVTLQDGVFPDLKCPACHEETMNFDSAYEVDKLNESEGSTPVYNQVTF